MSNDGRTAIRRIEAEGLTLEPQTAAHAEEMFDVLCDPAIYLHENEPPVSAEWLRARFARLESRASADGSEQWLNWVVRLPSGPLIGYVQATVRANGGAAIAYVLRSSHWRRGLARRATEAMIGELIAYHGVTRLTAVAKRTNLDSLHLLERLGFALATPEQHAALDVEPDEVLWLRNAT